MLLRDEAVEKVRALRTSDGFPSSCGLYRILDILGLVALRICGRRAFLEADCSVPASLDRRPRWTRLPAVDASSRPLLSLRCRSRHRSCFRDLQRRCSVVLTVPALPQGG